MKRKQNINIVDSVQIQIDHKHLKLHAPPVHQARKVRRNKKKPMRLPLKHHKHRRQRERAFGRILDTDSSRKSNQSK